MKIAIINDDKNIKRSNIDWAQINFIESRRYILWVPFVFGAGAALGLGPLCNIETKFLLILFSIILILFIALSFYFKNRHSIIIAIVHFLLLCCLLLLSGISIAQFRTKNIEAPIITNTQIYKNFSGKIINVSRSLNGNWRAKILVNSIDNINPVNLPKYIRLNIENVKNTNIGDIIKCDAFIAPPSMKIHPFAYDFSRDAWFDEIGGIGRCQNNISFIKANKINTFKQWIEIKRSEVSHEISKGKIGGGDGFLAAISTGDRSYISQNDMEALQISGLGHIVSVSGLHVSIVAGLVYFIFKKLFSLLPFIALRFDIRKIAAFISLSIVAYYTYFTGAEAPALRALIMTCVMMTGIFLNRKAISMRGLVVAALILLVLRPENALDSGFLMSFLATMALVALWEFWELKQFLKPRNSFEIIIFWIFGAALTSLVAGIATIPISLVNFQTMNTYGLFANLLSAPISDFIVAPMAIIGFVLKPFGFGDWFLEIASWGLSLILNIAYFFASLPLSSLFLDRFSILSTCFMVFAFIWFCLFQSNLRFLSIIPFICSLIAWGFAPKTIAIFASSGGAMLNLEKAKYNSIQVCYVPNEKYNAKRLINAANIPSEIKKVEIASLNNKYSNLCTLKSGNWEAHFIKEDSKKNNYIISLTIEGKTFALNKDNLPMGASILKVGNKIKLYIPLSKTKWQIAQTNNDDIMKQERLEP